jgi:hypothetical protein
MNQNHPDDRLWLLLLGAALVYKPIRDLAAKSLEDKDAPPELRPLWAAIKAGNGDRIREWLGCEPSGGTVMESVLRKVQERALSDFCKLALDHVKFSKGLTGEQVIDILDNLRSKIVHKQTCLEKNLESESRAE